MQPLYYFSSPQLSLEQLSTRLLGRRTELSDLGYDCDWTVLPRDWRADIPGQGYRRVGGTQSRPVLQTGFSNPLAAEDDYIIQVDVGEAYGIVYGVRSPEVMHCDERMAGIARLIGKDFAITHADVPPSLLEHARPQRHWTMLLGHTLLENFYPRG